MRKTHLHWAYPVDSFEITVEITNVTVATLRSDGFYRSNAGSQELRGSIHSHFAQVLMKRFTHFSAEQAESARFTESQDHAGALGGQLIKGLTFLYDPEKNTNPWVQGSLTILATRSECQIG